MICMRKLSKPTDNFGVPFVVLDTFRLCISRVRNVELKSRLRSVEDNIAEAAVEFDLAAESVTLYTIDRSNSVAGIVTKDEMISVYTGRMVPSTQPGRPIYDKIKNAAPLNRCPLCDVGVVTTLDHHLPKSEYPALAVTPNNLVPACTWCQDAKDNWFPNTAEQQTFHPYFDDFEGEVWLRAEVVEGTPASFEYSAAPPDAWDAVKIGRAQSHLTAFCLSVLYTSNAGQELVNIRKRLTDLNQAGGANAVKTPLLGEAETRLDARLNSWQSAMYSAAARSEWFCNGGFALV